MPILFGRSKREHIHAIDRVGNRSLVVFVHGIIGSYIQTWGSFPSLLHNDAGLTHYNFRFWGYPSPANPFYIPLLGHKTPDIDQVASAFLTYLESAGMNDYVDLVLVGHSMGGLVIRRALVLAVKAAQKYAELLCRIRHVALYASPSTGVEVANVLVIHPQARQLFKNSKFMTNLENDWSELIYTGDEDPGSKFHCRTTAIVGDGDAAVPRKSAEAHYENVKTIHGSHTEICKPVGSGDEAFTLLRHLLLAASPAPLIVGKTAIVERTIKIVRDARRHLFITGSRSHSTIYLRAIEKQLKTLPKLEYYRVLIGPPRTLAMRQHIINVLTERSPNALVDDEQVTFVSIFDNVDLQPEIFLCGNERCCIAILPPMTGIGEYSTGYYFTDGAHVEKYFLLTKEMLKQGRELLEPKDVPEGVS